MEVDVVHCTGINRHAAEELSQLATTAEGCNPMDDAVQVMSVSFLLKEARKNASDPTTSWKTATILALQPPARDFPPSAELRQ